MRGAELRGTRGGETPTGNMSPVTREDGRDRVDLPPDRAHSDSLGMNAWFVEEMYQAYRSNPLSVGDTWRDFFAEYRGPVPREGPAAAARPVSGGIGRVTIETRLAGSGAPAGRAE